MNFLISKILKGGLLLAFILFSQKQLRAQDDTMPSDPFTCATGKRLSTVEGSKVLENAQKTYSKLSHLEAHFSQDSFLSSLEISEHSNGLMWFSKPGLMKWHYNEPNSQDFLVRERTYWLYQKEDKQVVIDDFSDILISDLPIAFILGIGNLSDDFSLLHGCKSADGESFLLRLSPKQISQKNDEKIKDFELLVERDRFVPRGSRVVDTAGNITKIIFSSIVIDKAVEPEVFEPNYPDGIDIDDRREESV